MSSTRWCPTAEQLMILEEMYNRGGVRTPNASQIQHITAHLSLYGRIEGKNVFYWFQNHKARDRQKLRKRQLLFSNHHHSFYHHQFQHHYQYNHHFEHPFPAILPQVNYSTTSGAAKTLEGVDSRYNRITPTGSIDMEKKSLGSEWTAVTLPDMAPDSSRPLKTLELFPLTATPSLKESSSSTTTTNTITYSNSSC